MSIPPGLDLDGLIKWCARDEWGPRVDDVMVEHFMPAMQAFDLEFEAIDDALGGGLAQTLWGCAFEDFLTRRFGPENESPVEAYLRRRGWKERLTTRAYMTALQGSVMSLYEVSEIRPGQSFRARDLIRGGEPILVTERTATQALRPWDRIAARVVQQGDRSAVAGGVLAFTIEGSEQLFAGLRERAAAPPRSRANVRKTDGPLKGWTGSEEDLRRAAPLFSSTWLFDVLPRVLNPQPPTLFNSEGDEVVFHTVRFPFAPKATTRAIASRLQKLEQLRQETPTIWNWLGRTSSRRPATEGQKAVFWNVSLDDGSVVLGNIELKDSAVLLSVSSAARAERGRAMLSSKLVDLVAAPLTEIQTVEQMRAAAPQLGASAPQPPIPPEVQTELVHDLLDRQYRSLLNEPVPMLGGISPRAAARSARGRTSLAIWIKQLENHSSQAPDPNDPMATYDFTWLWRELKIEHLRN